MTDTANAIVRRRDRLKNKSEPPRYFTGKPCKNGHITERAAANGGCMECHRLRNARLRAKKKMKAEMGDDFVEEEKEVIDEHLPKGVIKGARVFIMGRQVR